MKYTLTIALLILLLSRSQGQKLKDITHREVNIHQNDSSIKATILLEEKKVKLHSLVNYYWYYNNSIKTNQGDFQGMLLDGGYHVTTRDGRLITKGNFRKGVKTGEWKNWNEKGELLRITNWKKGYKKGVYQKFVGGQLVENGKFKRNQLNGHYQKFRNTELIEEGNYKKGKLEGKQIKYQNDTVLEKTGYHHGKKIMPTEKKVKMTSENSEVKKKWWKFSKNNAEEDREEVEQVSDSKKKWWKFWGQRSEEEIKEPKTKKKKAKHLKDA